MIYLKLAIVWGSILEGIKTLLDETEGLYFGLFINQLRYKDKVSGRKEKDKYSSMLKVQISKINTKVKEFNQFSKLCFKDSHKLEKLPLIKFLLLKKIIAKHKGDYPAEDGIYGNFKETIGEGDSPLALAKKHTVLQLYNTLLPLRISLGRFVESLKRFEDPFREYIKNGDKLRSIVSTEIQKAMVCYSVDLKGEAVFIIGRALENLCLELLYVLKKAKKTTLAGTNIRDISFDQKLNILHYNLKKLTPNQFSKAMSLKWDRNIWGHRGNQNNMLLRDAEANISVGINLLFIIEGKINKYRK